MNGSGIRRIIPILLVLIIIVAAVWGLIAVGRALFSGGSSPSPSPSVNTGQEQLTNTDASHSVRMTVRGPIVAEENAHSYSITVSNSSRVMTTFVGYVGQQVGNEQLGNNVQAYQQFVNALSRAHLMDGRPLEGSDNNTDGICATGSLFQFDVLVNNNSVQQLWTTTCKGLPGSLKANLVQVSSLFQKQIPDFKTQMNKIGGTSAT